MKQNKDTPVSGTTVKKKSLLNILLKIFGALFIAFLGFLLYILLTLNAGVATNLVDSYSPISPSIIYDINGNQIDIISTESRDPISVKDIPLNVQNAFLAIEDRKFRTHHGFDFMRVGKAIFGYFTRTSKEGGSSITQQLAKNAFLTPERTPIRKFKEAFLAIEIERRYTKDEILENYLNTIYFGQGAYGIKNASLT